MCRPGRRCPAHQDPAHRALQNVRQRLARHERSRRHARAAGDAAGHARQVATLHRDLASCTALHADRAVALANRAGPAPSGETPALLRALADADRDPAVEAQILEALGQRCAAATDADRRREHGEAVRAWRRWSERNEADTSPLTDPATRVLAAEDALIERYESWTHERVLDALDDHPGIELRAAYAIELGLDVATLHRLPGPLAHQLATGALREWWRAHGRITAAVLLAWTRQTAQR